uniref:Sugar fermentation stimulation protein C-terminal domain-containing protein n=1 Tax=viral metagenome TaxID=1070528 RepID=A0A6C0IGQ1_9ZZZZ
MMIMKIENLVPGTVVKRPSKIIKSPYVADVNINNTEFLAHTAALGCCGLCDTGAAILLAPLNNTSKKPKKSKEDSIKCVYSAQLAVINEKGNEIIIGIHPKLAEQLVENCLIKNYLSSLQDCKKYRRESVVFVENKVDSRFDFTGIDKNNIPFIMEVKNVPLADYEDLCLKDRKKMNYDERAYDSKIAYFPDGYRKKSTDPVSPRALKHIRELTLIKKESITRCIMCYVIQRTDVDRFQPSIIDPEYRQAFKEAVEAGVEIITLVIKWTRDGEAYFVKDDLFIVPVL